MKLTQKMDHFTAFKSFPSTSCCSQKLLPNKIETFGQLDVRGSIRNVYIGWVVGDGIVDKGTKSLQGTREAQKLAWKGCGGSIMAEMRQKIQCGSLDCQQHWILLTKALASARNHHSSLHITVNLSLLESASRKHTKV